MEHFDELVTWSIQHTQRIGYFAAVHRSTARAIAGAVDRGEFDDADRMRHLLLTFGSRFFDAVAAWRTEGTPSRSWQVAFDMSADEGFLVLQHLFVAFNAHIRLDLGVAAATVAPGKRLESLRADFARVNTVLDSMVGRCRRTVEELSPRLRNLDRLGHMDEILAEQVLNGLRHDAWDAAESLAPLDTVARSAAVDRLDAKVAATGRWVRHPDDVLALVMHRLVLPAEERVVPSVIERLAACEPDLTDQLPRG